jgi:hypothetical protein
MSLHSTTIKAARAVAAKSLATGGLLQTAGVQGGPKRDFEFKDLRPI